MPVNDGVAAGLSRLVTAINNLAGRALPSGGTAGQALIKTSAVNYAANWQTPAAGATPVIEILNVVIPVAVYGQYTVIINHALTTESSFINAQLVPNGDFDIDNFDDLELQVDALAGQIEFILFSPIVVGTYKIAYQVLN